MNENERKADGTADKPGRAQHGYRNEVSWNGGEGSQPYTNQEEEKGPAAARETEAGNRGAASGRNQEQLEQVKGPPERLADSDRPPRPE
jgi:hypothetical protein